MTLPTNAQDRKERPLARGLLDYFPDALAAVANVSYVGNQQHNPGEEMHWAREKSSDHADCVMRHLIDRGTFDEDGLPHTAKAAWRVLAMLQLEEEDRQQEKATPASTENWRRVTAQDLGCDGFSPAATAAKLMKSDSVYRNFARSARLYRDLTEQGCQPPIAHTLVRSVRYPKTGEPTGFVYVCGPMRGYEKLNFPAFDRARDFLVDAGYAVISPADIDRASGVNENEVSEDVAQGPREFVYRDFWAIFGVLSLDPENARLALLPGWERSTGAAAEIMLARWLGIRAISAEDGLPVPDLMMRQLTSAVRAYLRQ